MAPQTFAQKLQNLAIRSDILQHSDYFVVPRSQLQIRNLGSFLRPRRKAKSASFYANNYHHPKERYQLEDIQERGSYQRQDSPPTLPAPRLDTLFPLFLLLSSVATVLIMPTAMPNFLQTKPSIAEKITSSPPVIINNHFVQNSSTALTSLHVYQHCNPALLSPRHGPSRHQSPWPCPTPGPTPGPTAPPTVPTSTVPTLGEQHLSSNCNCHRNCRV